MIINLPESENESPAFIVLMIIVVLFGALAYAILQAVRAVMTHFGGVENEQ